jgi:hypothetical protein
MKIISRGNNVVFYNRLTPVGADFDWERGYVNSDSPHDVYAESWGRSHGGLNYMVMTYDTSPIDIMEYDFVTSALPIRICPIDPAGAGKNCLGRTEIGREFSLATVRDTWPTARSFIIMVIGYYADSAEVNAAITLYKQDNQ